MPSHAKFIALLLTSLAISSHAALPPKYLQVKDFKQCLSTHQIDTYTAWCMPAQKSEGCPAASWKQLKALAGKDKVADCPQDPISAPSSAPPLHSTQHQTNEKLKD
jgi:hypothetical protein